jgi:hypothetical protein
MKKIILSLLFFLASAHAAIVVGNKVNELGLNLSNVQTGNASTGKHGLFPALPGSPGAVFSGSGATGRWVTNILNVQEFGAVADGVTDNSAVYAAIDALSTTNIVLYFPAGLYAGNRTWTNKNLRFSGDGLSTILLPFTATNLFRFASTNQRVFYKDLQFDMAFMDASALTHVGIDLADFESVTVSNAGDVGGVRSIDGVNFTSPWGTIRARNSHFYRCERDGIIIWPAYDATVENCTSDYHGRGGIVADKGGGGPYPTYGSTRVKFERNTVTDCGAIGVYTEGYTNSPMTISLRGNVVKRTGNGDAIWGYSYGVTAGNYALGDIIGNTVEDFSLTGSASGYGNGMDISRVSGTVNIIGNIVLNTRGIGIKAASTIGGVSLAIRGNTVSNAVSGVSLYLFPDSDVSGNFIYNSRQIGAVIHTSPRTSFHGNLVSGSSYTNSGAYPGVKATLSPGLKGSGNGIDSIYQSTGFEHDASLPKTWSENRTVTSVSGPINNLGNCSDIAWVNGKRRGYGTASPTYTGPVAGDYVENTSYTLGAPRGWIYGADAAWHADWALGNESLNVGTNSGTGFGVTLSVNGNSSAMFAQRADATKNSFSLLLGSNTNSTSGVLLSARGDINSDGQPDPLGDMAIYAGGFAHHTEAGLNILVGSTANRNVGLRTIAGSTYGFDANNAGSFRTTTGNYLHGGTVGAADAPYGLYFVTGSPEGVLTATRGIAVRLDGGAGTTLYVKESGTGNTGWVAK